MDVSGAQTSHLVCGGEDKDPVKGRAIEKQGVKSAGPAGPEVVGKEQRRI